ncbi:flagellar type III secretion system protein FliR [Phreatobacter aquaticus]|uniref:Flagellar biosynthetic protein FliR n=1 Tax=Phreatobacter aquaticus TaxID=2570229 RepID=A0A4D7QNI6_9HYPH|nr:flagellar biosynthetic protein FliR [Phreatobacter aquaticus]QCK88061.1 flagellar type III secretion system protein FliR [Phreatobacter aquaticus]
MSVTLSPAFAVIFLLMFSRVGMMLVLLPGLGDRSMPARFRLVVALMVTATLYPLHQALYTIDLARPASVIMILFQELAIGFTLGMAGRMAVSALQTAGLVIATSMGLGFAMQVDPTQGSQGAVIGTFLSMVGLAIIFATDLHHLVIMAISDSFTTLRPGVLPASGDAAQFLTGMLTRAFFVAIQLSAPFLVFALVFNVGLGVLAKLMPQMQVFFVGMPLTIGVGFMILLLCIGVMMTHYAGHLESMLNDLAVNRR